MTAKDKEPEEAHLSNNIHLPGPEGSPCKLDLENSGGAATEGIRNWGWMLSGVIGLNILILGSALASGSAYNNVKITMPDVQIFLIILLLLTTLWMIYYIIYTARKDNAVIYKDGHAGPVWLRGKLMLFFLKC